MEKMLSVAQVCNILHVHRTTLYKLIDKKALKAIDINLNQSTGQRRRLRIYEKSVTKFIKEHKVQL